MYLQPLSLDSALSTLPPLSLSLAHPIPHISLLISSSALPTPLSLSLSQFQSHTPTGSLLASHASDVNVSLSELVRQERFSGGASDQKDMDAAMASRIAQDGRFKNDEDYLEENAEKLARGRERTGGQKKLFAVQGGSVSPSLPLPSFFSQGA